MGVFIGTKRCNIAMGYGSFSNFRIEVAKAFSEDFGEQYKDYLNKACKELFCGTEENIKRLDKDFSAYLKTVDISDDIVNFLFQTDCGGKINCKTARKIRDLCNKSKCEYKFGYDSDKRTIKEIAEIFDDAVKHRCNVKW